MMKDGLFRIRFLILLALGVLVVNTTDVTRGGPLTIRVIPNYTYSIQTTSNLSLPWGTVSTNAVGTNGTLVLASSNATNAQQYYRTARAVGFQQNILFRSSTVPTQTIPYALFAPAVHDDQTNQLYPLVLFLHGSGNRGTDTLAASLREAVQVFARTTNQSVYPAFLLAPVCPTSSQWAMNTNKPNMWSVTPYTMAANPTPELRMAVELVQSVMQTCPIDPKRVYLIGESMGGYGAWEGAVRYPNLWAAVVPLMGGTDPSKASIVKNLPIWTFHAADDPTVPVTGTRLMVAALQQAGGNPLYTEYATGGHSISATAVNTPGFVDWFYAQHK